ncbi:hypothetical protein XENORESO_011207, partial [Xenotaenia resolanae]
MKCRGQHYATPAYSLPEIIRRGSQRRFPGCRCLGGVERLVLRMLLVLSEDHKEHLSFLTKVDGSVVEEFGRIALEFLKKGTNPKVYEGAA